MCIRDRCQSSTFRKRVTFARCNAIDDMYMLEQKQLCAIVLLNECLLTRHRTGSSIGVGTNSVSFSDSFLHPSFVLLLPFFFCFAIHAFFSSRDPPPLGVPDTLY